MLEEHDDQGDLFEGTEYEREEECIPEKRSYIRRNEVAAHCSVCGKPMSDPISVARGIGPECFQDQMKTGQDNYKSNLFMIKKDGGRIIASCTIENIADDVVLITDLDDDEDLPSVTNSIDAILHEYEINLDEIKVIVCGSDKMYCEYKGDFKYLSWDRSEVIEKFKK